MIQQIRKLQPFLKDMLCSGFVSVHLILMSVEKTFLEQERTKANKMKLCDAEELFTGPFCFVNMVPDFKLTLFKYV